MCIFKLMRKVLGMERKQLPLFVRPHERSMVGLESWDARSNKMYFRADGRRANIGK